MKRLRLNVGCIVCFVRKTEFLRSDWKCKAFHEWQLLGSLHQVLSVYEKGITSVAGAVWFSCSHKRNLETNCLKLLMTKIKSRSLIFLATLSIPCLSQRGVTPTEAWTFRAKQKWTLQTYEEMLHTEMNQKKQSITGCSCLACLGKTLPIYRMAVLD